MKFIFTLWTLAWVCLTPAILTAQNRTCAASDMLENMLKANPDMQERMEYIERHTQEFLQRTPSVSERTVINIPVVVHVVYNSAVENISDAQVQSQIDVLNRDFRRLNAEVAAIPSTFFNVAADVEINFCLATITPTGTATNGINRYQTTKTSWSSNDDMKRPAKDGVAAWDATRYLNIWVCNLGSGSLGYSSFPGAPLSLDGVVIDYRYFGTVNTRAPFHLGRTTTHEVGHWLNLFHIWGDTQCGDDHVDDTPVHHGANFGCPIFPSYNSTCGNNIIEMPMNFMDYTNDACMSMFTQGQKARMRSLFAVGGARYSFTQSNLCGTVVSPIVCNTPTNFALSSVTDSSAKISWAVAEGARSYTLEYKPNFAAVWKTVNDIPSNSFNMSDLLAATIYHVRIKTICTNGGESSFSNTIYLVTGARVEPVTCSDNFEPNNTRSTAKPLSTNKIEKGLVGYAGDRDWYYFKLEAGTTINISLTGLPADYDIKFYDSRLRLLRSSENMGNTNESIRYTTTIRDSFLVVVYGYNGAFDEDNCYNLNISANQWALSTAQKTELNIEESPAILNTNNRFEQNTEGGLKVFPNPANEAVTLQIAPEFESHARISLTNLSGQTLVSETKWVSKTENTITLDLSSVPSGFYMVSVRQGEQIWTKKLVKK
ncbi:MAG: T9SS type A sorting domain-containing protein [Saprospiraceae bacterium]|nr:T9SS type A sorting domain-containing protein [Saprospiraceae bacterium]